MKEIKEVIKEMERKDFLIIKRDCLDDKSISLDAKGLLLFMRENPNGSLYDLNNDSKETIDSALDELLKAGYVMPMKDAKNYVESVLSLKTKDENFCFSLPNNRFLGFDQQISDVLVAVFKDFLRKE